MKNLREQKNGFQDGDRVQFNGVRAGRIRSVNPTNAIVEWDDGAVSLIPTDSLILEQPKGGKNG